MKKNKSSSKLGKKRLPHNNGVVRSNNNNDNDVIVITKRHYDKNGGHPHIILGDIDNDKHVSIGLSTKPKKGNTSKSNKNYKMEHSPYNDNQQSYMRRQDIVDFINNYSDVRIGRISKKDYDQAKKYGAKAKKKYLAKKK